MRLVFPVQGKVLKQLPDAGFARGVLLLQEFTPKELKADVTVTPSGKATAKVE